MNIKELPEWKQKLVEEMKKKGLEVYFSENMPQIKTSTKKPKAKSVAS